jgi:RNA recognition motif-containing protein
MSFTVFLGNLPVWVTADDIKGWLTAENLVADAIKVIRNPETQESKGFAFIEAPNTEEMNSIIRRFDRAPLEDRLLRANPAQPPKPKGATRPGDRPERGPERGPEHRPERAPYHAPTSAQPVAAASSQSPVASTSAPVADQRPPRRGKRSAAGAKRAAGGPQSAFAEELAKAL